MADTNENVLDELVARCSAGERIALCTVVRTRGSCPQSAGAKMLVLADGRTRGTLGGGCVEAEVRTRAIQMLQRDESGLLEFSLDHDYGWDDGLICGGIMDIVVQSLDRARVAPFEKQLSEVRAGLAATIRIPYARAGAETEYVETIEPQPALVIAGAGHVGQALARLAPDLGFV